jgi:cytolysin-activating lysine-acyltransferase
MILGRSKPKAPEKPQEAPQPKAAEAPQPKAAEAPGNDAAGKGSAIRPRDLRQIRFATSFAQVVAVLMRDPNFRKLPLGDLEWLVLPPLMSGQFRLAHLPAPQTANNGTDKQAQGMMVPVAVALWASVSDALDKQLSEQLDKPARLPTDKWVSGKNIWLMAAAGDPRAIPAFLDQLAKADFKGQEVKMRRRGPDGKVVIARLGENK